MTQEFCNPCHELRERQHQLESIGYAMHCVRDGFSPGDGWTSTDQTIAHHCEALRDVQLLLARELIAAADRHDVWIKEQREQAAAEVNADDQETT